MGYVIYRRVSTTKQGESGLGLDAQDRDINLYLSSYDTEGKVIGSYTDILSGKDDKRPELKKAIEHCKRDGATLLVSKLDRLSRKVSFIASLIEDKALDFRVAQMPHADKFQLHIYAALAEQERDFISKRTKAALAEAKARGVSLGGLRPGTAKRNEAVAQQADKHAQHIWPTIKAYRDAGSTLQQVADELNRLDIQTARGGKWHASTVSNIVKRIDMETQEAV